MTGQTDSTVGVREKNFPSKFITETSEGEQSKSGEHLARPLDQLLSHAHASPRPVRMQSEVRVCDWVQTEQIGPLTWMWKHWGFCHLDGYSKIRQAWNFEG